MRRTGSQPPELVLPVASLAALRRALISEVGPDAAARVLRVSGHAAGESLCRLLHGQTDAGGFDDEAAPGRDTTAAVYWRRLSELFSARGWGRLTHSPLGEALGALESGDWVEADPEEQARRPSCFFTTGLLANLLGETADAEIGVLEVECRSQGDALCRFLFGGPDALETVYDGLRAGQTLDASLGQLVS